MSDMMRVATCLPDFSRTRRLMIERQLRGQRRNGDAKKQTGVLKSAPTDKEFPLLSALEDGLQFLLRHEPSNQ